MATQAQRVYLDHNATTPIAPSVAERIAEVSRDIIGNPSSLHAEGATARLELERARRRAARLLGTRPECVTFNAGGTAGANIAIQGTVSALVRRGSTPPQVVTAATEHKAVLDCCRLVCERHGLRLVITACGNDGRPDRAELEDAIASGQVSFVSIMAANNELGCLNDIPSLARTIHAANPRNVFHTDAVQWAGHLAIDFDQWGVDLLTASAHKFYGPRGTGFLLRRGSVELDPLMTGGSQEGGLAPGTENLPGASGLVEALDLLDHDAPMDRNSRLLDLRERFWASLCRKIPGVLRNSPVDGCLPHLLNVSFPGADGRRMTTELDRLGFAVSPGSACTSGGTTTSHVLGAAFPGQDDRVRGAVRIGLGLSTRPGDAEAFAEAAEQAYGAALSAVPPDQR